MNLRTVVRFPRLYNDTPKQRMKRVNRASLLLQRAGIPSHMYCRGKAPKTTLSISVPAVYLSAARDVLFGALGMNG